jgi:hypothetical protein
LRRFGLGSAGIWVTFENSGQRSALSDAFVVRSTSIRVD